MCWLFGWEACGILTPRPGMEPAPPALEGGVPTTGPPGKSLVALLNANISICFCIMFFSSSGVGTLLSSPLLQQLAECLPYKNEMMSDDWVTHIAHLDRGKESYHHPSVNTAIILDWR